MKAFIRRIIEQQAGKIYSDSTFGQQFADIYVITYVIRFLASSFSMVTGFFFLYTLFSNQLSGWTVHVIAAIVILIVELLKYYITPKGFANLFKSKFGYAVGALIVALPLYGASIYFTVHGVEDFFESRNQDIQITESKQEVDLSEKITYYDSLIKVEQVKYDKVFNAAVESKTITWKTTVDQLSRIESRIDDQMKKKEDVLQEIKLQQAEEIDEVEEKTFALKDELLYISISSETILFLIFLFGQYYLYRFYIENQPKQESSKKPQSTKKQTVKISVGKLGTVQLPKDGSRLDQVKAFVAEGIKDPNVIAKKIGTHPNYVRTLINKSNT